ncbi:hypothetical protein FB45DRAFT_835313 [Roridomyces roridus]|uniref:Uncharacterized protein n=1 Tax=Roridomyces roridus TaxID=1738132 RepID=A0AAD7BPI2_9AGAR|nr:hypothetical protein FB45DRAFT_835313 [Roridomyces roridus]
MWNPYYQGGWPNAGPSSSAGNSPVVPQPSIFGALPYASTPTSPGPPPTFMSFRFTTFNPTILDSTVVGPKAQAYFLSNTDTPSPGFTVVHNSANKPIIVIQWARHPVIEICDILSKRHTSKWLTLSPDKSFRTMSARGRTFVWVPEGQYISLYSSGLGAPQIYGRILRGEETVTLELTTEAIQVGLLEVCVAATLLLQCGRNID